MRPAAGIITLLGRETGDMAPDLLPDPAVKTVVESLDDGLSAFADLETRCLSLGMGREDVVRALDVLVDRPEIHLCRLAPVNSDPKPKSDYRPSGQFNRFAEARRKRANRSNLFLASPVTGAGLTLGPGLASAFNALFAEQSNGEPGELPTPNVLREFEERILPRLHRLGIVD
jgi:hypothetical protein